MKLQERLLGEWRMKDRLKTLHGVLTLCLNIGVDPPDVVRVPPSCVRLVATVVATQ